MKKSNPLLKNRVGETYTANLGYKFTIIKYNNKKSVTIQFEDGTIIENKQYSSIKKGNIKNPNYPSLYSIGFIGIGEYSTKNKKIYRKWASMFDRCCGVNNNPTYKNTIIHKNWHCLQDFAKWYKENYKLHMKEWVLDKDILVKSNKVYSPDTCCFVPQEINSLFIKKDINRGLYPIGVYFNKSSKKFIAQISIKKIRKILGTFDTAEEAFQAYKTAKEEHIKEVANKWKELIDSKVYKALINYQVEITD